MALKKLPALEHFASNFFKDCITMVFYAVQPKVIWVRNAAWASQRALLFLFAHTFESGGRLYGWAVAEAPELEEEVILVSRLVGVMDDDWSLVKDCPWAWQWRQTNSLTVEHYLVKALVAGQKVEPPFVLVPEPA
jgi:hypothetical protein